MDLSGKVAVVYGGGGAVGGAVARAFAAAGARVHLAGRTKARLEAVAAGVDDGAGVAGLAEVDVLDPAAVVAHADAVAAEAGRLDVAVDAVAFPFVHDRPVADVAVDDLVHPVTARLRAALAVTKAVAPHMAARRSGVVLLLSAGAARLAGPGNLGYGTACAAVEELAQRLAVELGPDGVRTVALRSHLLADGPAHDSSATELVARRAAAAGVAPDAWLARAAQDVTLLGRLPTLAELAATATFLASDHAAALTGAVVDLTGGNAVRTAAGALVGLLG